MLFSPVSGLELLFGNHDGNQREGSVRLNWGYTSPPYNTLIGSTIVKYIRSNQQSFLKLLGTLTPSSHSLHFSDTGKTNRDKKGKEVLFVHHIFHISSSDCFVSQTGGTTELSFPNSRFIFIS